MRNIEDLSMALMWVGFALLVLPIPALTIALAYNMLWLSSIMVLTMWIGLMMIAVGTIV